MQCTGFYSHTSTGAASHERSKPIVECHWLHRCYMTAAYLPAAHLPAMCHIKYGTPAYDTPSMTRLSMARLPMAHHSTVHIYEEECSYRRATAPQVRTFFFGFFVSVQPASHVAMPQSNQPISLLATWLCFHYRMSPFVNSANHFAPLRKSACGPAIPRTFGMHSEHMIGRY